VENIEARTTYLEAHLTFNEKFARWQFMVTTALLLIILGFVIANSSRLSSLEARFGEFDRRLSVIEQRLLK